MRRILLITVIFLHFINLYGQKLDFYKEIIKIEVFENYCTVEGEYFFHNENNISTMILYPFVINDRLSYPDSISIVDKNGKSLKYKNRENSVIFPFEKSEYFKAFYRQKTVDNYFEYILTTTASWGEALQEADFIIKVDKYLNLINLSLPYNKIEKSDDFIIYHISRKNYLPVKNIIIEWREQ